jgi:putative transposase
MSADYPFPGYHQQQNSLPKAKKLFPHLASVPSQVLQTNIRRRSRCLGFLSKAGLRVSEVQKVWADEVNTFSSIQNKSYNRMAN